MGKKYRALLVNDADNVATALEDLSAGEDVAFERGGAIESLKAAQDIPFGHKFATEDVAKGSLVIKYGEEIGGATCDIRKGEHVHVHNTESLRGRGDLRKR